MNEGHDPLEAGSAPVGPARPRSLPEHSASGCTHQENSRHPPLRGGAPHFSLDRRSSTASEGQIGSVQSHDALQGRERCTRLDNSSKITSNHICSMNWPSASACLNFICAFFRPAYSPVRARPKRIPPPAMGSCIYHPRGKRLKLLCAPGPMRLVARPASSIAVA